MTVYVVLSNNSEVGSAFGEIARVKARTPGAAISRVVREGGWDWAEHGPFAAVAERYFYVPDDEGLDG